MMESTMKAIVCTRYGPPEILNIAKHFKAEVTAVCSEAGLDLVKVLGADKVILNTKEDFTQSGEQYDIVFDAVG